MKVDFANLFWIISDLISSLLIFLIILQVHSKKIQQKMVVKKWNSSDVSIRTRQIYPTPVSLCDLAWTNFFYHKFSVYSECSHHRLIQIVGDNKVLTQMTKYRENEQCLKRQIYNQVEKDHPRNFIEISRKIKSKCTRSFTLCLESKDMFEII